MLKKTSIVWDKWTRTLDNLKDVKSIFSIVAIVAKETGVRATSVFMKVEFHLNEKLCMIQNS